VAGVGERLLTESQARFKVAVRVFNRSSSHHRRKSRDVMEQLAWDGDPLEIAEQNEISSAGRTFRLKVAVIPPISTYASSSGNKPCAGIFEKTSPKQKPFGLDLGD